MLFELRLPFAIPPALQSLSVKQSFNVLYSRLIKSKNKKLFFCEKTLSKMQPLLGRSEKGPGTAGRNVAAALAVGCALVLAGGPPPAAGGARVRCADVRLACSIPAPPSRAHTSAHACGCVRAERGPLCALAASLSLTRAFCPTAVAVVDLQGQGAQTTELAQLMEGPSYLAGKRIRVMRGPMLAYDAVSGPTLTPNGACTRLCSLLFAPGLVAAGEPAGQCRARGCSARPS
jgi:hypothetical protein